MATSSVCNIQPLASAGSYFMNERFDYRVARTWKFCQMENQETARNIFFTCISAGTAAGFVAGNELGRKIEGFFQSYNGEDSDEENNHFGGLVGKLLGGTIGGFCGLWGGIQLIEQAPKYQNWVNSCLDQALKNALDAKYTSDPVIEKFSCPISENLIFEPVFSPDSKHFYDFNFISKCPKDISGKIIDPYRSSPSFYHFELLKDPEMGFIIWKRIHVLVNQDFEKELNSDSKAALSKHLKNIEQFKAKLYNEARDAIELRRKNKTVTTEEYEKEIDKFKTLFGSDENQEIDWSKDWRTLLIQRWEYFHPGTKVFS